MTVTVVLFFIMSENQMAIGDLAEAAGVSRRAIRFYIQRGLLPRPYGAGRGSGYDQEHLDRLRRILDLQASGYSLDAIASILVGKPAEPPPEPSRHRRVRGPVQASLWAKVLLAEGVELSVDTSRHMLTAEEILSIRQAVLAVLSGDRVENNAANENDEKEIDHGGD